MREREDLLLLGDWELLGKERPKRRDPACIPLYFRSQVLKYERFFVGKRGMVILTFVPLGCLFLYFYTDVMNGN